MYSVNAMIRMAKPTAFNPPHAKAVNGGIMRVSVFRVFLFGVFNVFHLLTCVSCVFACFSV